MSQSAYDTYNYSSALQGTLEKVKQREASHTSIFDKFRGSSYSQFMTLAGIPLASMGSAIGVAAGSATVGVAAPLAGAVLMVAGASIATAAFLAVGDKIGKGLVGLAKGLGHRVLDATENSTQAWKNIQETCANLEPHGLIRQQTHSNLNYLSNILETQVKTARNGFEGVGKDVQKSLLNGLKPKELIGPDVLKMHKAFMVGSFHAAGTPDARDYYNKIVHGMNEYFKNDGLKEAGLGTRLMAHLSDRFRDNYAEKQTQRSLSVFDAAQKMGAHQGLTVNTDFFSTLKEAGLDNQRQQPSIKERQEPGLG